MTYPYVAHTIPQISVEELAPCLAEGDGELQLRKCTGAGRGGPRRY
jgi:hypothetical protein